MLMQTIKLISSKKNLSPNMIVFITARLSELKMRFRNCDLIEIHTYLTLKRQTQ